MRLWAELLEALPRQGRPLGPRKQGFSPSGYACTCPHCMQAFALSPDMLGQSVSCSTCKDQFALRPPVPQPRVVSVAIPSPKLHARPCPPTCPLCGQGLQPQTARQLYGHVVCWKCYLTFAQRRHIASLLDVGGFFLFGFTAGLLFGVMAGILDLAPGTAPVITTLLAWLLLPLWFCKDCFDGQSLGKALCGVRVIDETTGAPCDIGTSFKRNLPLIIPFMPVIAAIQLCQGHRIGDGWSNTKVVWKKYANHPIFAPVKERGDHPAPLPLTTESPRRDAA